MSSVCRRGDVAQPTQFTVKKKYPCPDCSNTYSRRAYMMNHYRHVHMNQSKYYCSTCERHFLNRTRYIDHMRYNHEGVKKEKNKLCNICGRGFAVSEPYATESYAHPLRREAVRV
uniref:SFRICE_036007 n=1 Tax=Spodoptera frugiperda TaxID=7108 RepID=A0A2H1WVC4_SPOFR